MQCVIDGGELRKVARYVFKSDVFRSIYTDRFIYKCAECGLRQANVACVDNDALTHYYQHDYRNVARIGRADIEANRIYFRARGKALAELIGAAPQRVFELGSGYGFNLEAVRARFPDARLFTDEVDQTVEMAADVAAARLADGPWDVVILSHVVEHFTDPAALLREVKANLAPDGVAIVEVPNDIEGIVPLNGPDEPHLAFFTAPTMRLLLEQVGFDIVDLFTAGMDNRIRNAKYRLKAAVRATLLRVPGGKRLLDDRSARIMTSVDLGVRNPRGSLLRAVVKA
jgi:SAM-dependent methyltransferase